MGRAVVVIPLYREKLEWYEEISLRQAMKLFSQEDCIFILLEGASYDYIPTGDNFHSLYFNKSFFTGVDAYSRLLLSPDFYRYFMAYEYMLIYQLDAFAFDNRLAEFCNLGYDYYGAPWPRECGENYIEDNVVWHNVGNGGFSLRRVQACYDLVRRYQAQMNHLNLPEDVMISYYGHFSENDFKIAPVSVAYSFAGELNPVRAWHKNGQQLPFCCHGWHHYSKDFYLSAFGLIGIALAAHETAMDNLDLINQQVCYREWLVRIGA